MKDGTWRANSRGLKVDRNISNVGAISKDTLNRLSKLQIIDASIHRMPIQLTYYDMLDADLIIAVKKAEHYKLLNERFPGWQDKVTYWHIDDLDCSPPNKTLDELTEHVSLLLQNF